MERWPAVLALAAAAGWGTSTIWGRVATTHLPFELVTALRILGALPALIIAAVLQGQTGVPARPQFVTLIWLALIPGLAALILYYRGLRHTPASQATIAELAFPAVASLLNWLVLGASATAVQVFGFAIIWTAIFALSLQRTRSDTELPARSVSIRELGPSKLR
jgi:drug/metabolite transporter (DMT)-like permease